MLKRSKDALMIMLLHREYADKHMSATSFKYKEAFNRLSTSTTIQSDLHADPNTDPNPGFRTGLVYTH